VKLSLASFFVCGYFQLTTAKTVAPILTLRQMADVPFGVLLNANDASHLGVKSQKNQPVVCNNKTGTVNHIERTIQKALKN